MFYRMVFFQFLVMTIIVNLITNSWMIMWVSLEMNLLFIIPLMNNNSKLSIEASMKYFMIQALASTMILMSILNYSLFDLTILMNTALFMKMGLAPFHMWYPEVLSGISWNCNFILMTIQKIPLLNMLYLNMIPNYIYIIIITTIIISTISIFNMINLQKIMAYSSMSNMAWILVNYFNSISMVKIYFLIYMLITFMIIFFFNYMKIFNLNNLINTSIYLKMNFSIQFLSTGGLPPFLGFFPKWMTLQLLIPNNFYMALFMAMFTLIILFVYMRIIYMSFIIIKKNFLYLKTNLMFLFLNFIVNIMLIFWMSLFNLN